MWRFVEEHRPASLEDDEWIEWRGDKCEDDDGLGFTNVDGINSMGSEPLNCFDKCLGCIPCEAVLVAEKGSEGGYYPEHWMCKCGDKLFKP
ncbi:hypothetical protein QJS04_geneDACA016148 [Acorus gramineus]|uniref:Epidermal patterning factor-like protein n=1 Tax=Acorus gramineus TaxID=55184 RepID=A0AAV9AMN8_ACOGR|nr:hypothetical protein QJS04_geneDACA016148 [Acorus gramineus]